MEQVTVLHHPRLLLAGFSFFGDPFHSHAGWTEANEIGRLWQRLFAFWQESQSQVPANVMYEVHVQNSETPRTGEFEIFVGYEVTSLDGVPFDAVSRVIAFIEANLLAPIDVAAMAEVASYSLYYFCRLFGKVTRHTPHDYLIRRRMTEAATAVVESQRKIVDIAFDYQFNSHEGFTRAFGRMYGLSPSEARQQGAVPSLCRLSPLTRQHLLCLQSHNYLIPEIISGLPPAYHTGLGPYGRR